MLDTWDSLSLDNREPLEAGTVSASHTLTGLSQVRNLFMEARIQTHFAKICFIFSVFSFILSNLYVRQDCTESRSEQETSSAGIIQKKNLYLEQKELVRFSSREIKN